MLVVISVGAIKLAYFNIIIFNGILYAKTNAILNPEGLINCVKYREILGSRKKNSIKITPFLGNCLITFHLTSAGNNFTLVEKLTLCCINGCLSIWLSGLWMPLVFGLTSLRQVSEAIVLEDRLWFPVFPKLHEPVRYKLRWGPTLRKCSIYFSKMKNLELAIFQIVAFEIFWPHGIFIIGLSVKVSRRIQSQLTKHGKVVKVDRSLHSVILIALAIFQMPSKFIITIKHWSLYYLATFFHESFQFCFSSKLIEKPAWWISATKHSFLFYTFHAWKISLLQKSEGLMYLKTIFRIAFIECSFQSLRCVSITDYLLRFSNCCWIVLFHDLKKVEFSVISCRWLLLRLHWSRAGSKAS